SIMATPAAGAPAQPVTLAWAVSGATSMAIDNGVGDVSGKTSVVVYPSATTTYTLTAMGAGGSGAAQTIVTVASARDTQPPAAPTLVSAVAKSATEVDLTWLGSTDNVGVTGYQVLRNGSAIASVAASALTYADASVSGGSTYTYSVKAYDAAGNYSPAGNSVQATTPASSLPPGACPAAATGAWTACYYGNTSLSGNTILVRTDNQINFDYLSFPPDNSVPSRNFSVRWQGNFLLNPGTYTFTVLTGDGIRLSIDGQLILNNWQDRFPTVYTVTQAVSAGTHLIEVDHYEVSGGDVAQISWKNTSVAPNAPLISSFTATPSNATAGQTVTLSWTVSGATSVSIDNGVGDVTGRSSAVVTPAQTTTYTLSAMNPQGVASAPVTVTVPVTGTPLPTPTLVSAIAKSANEIDLIWIPASTPGIASYGIVRNGYQLTTVPSSQNTYVDTDVYTSSLYTYSIRAYDAAGNYSSQSNSIQVTTPNAPDISVTWYGGCWLPGAVFGITGNLQEVDFSLKTTLPVPVQGTLFDGLDCKATGGDNMNDFNTLTGTTHMLRGFTHEADISPVSAVFWIGERTADGKCPAGSTLCSPCYNYDKTTPMCSALP
ncbi:MAG: PA14 domain-containing protein, partial [Acidobacteriota bacterium]